MVLRTRLEQVATDDGKNFKNVHIHIMNIKGCLRLSNYFYCDLSAYTNKCILSKSS